MHGQEAYVDKEVKFKTANYYAAHAASHAAHTDTLQSLGPHLLKLERLLQSSILIALLLDTFQRHHSWERSRSDSVVGTTVQD
nr:hypothetical protein Iba_chr01aCG14730 [Ipomoea batatas]